MRLPEDVLKNYALPLLAFPIAFLLTFLVRRVALAKGMLDHPNARSSHSRPTPRGGGIAIVIGASFAAICSLAQGAVDSPQLIAFLVGGLLIAWIGFLDDRSAVRVRTRFAVHVAVAVLAVYLFGGLPPLQVGARQVDLGLVGAFIGVVAIIWTLNLFNFMDGIDGLAASEAIFVASAGACLAGFQPDEFSATALSIGVAAASLGFLLWNWPPAKIFMGDVGSGFLGYSIAVLALAQSRRDTTALYMWAILGGAFFVDATVTLIRRVIRGERADVAHRTHAYQWLSRRWQSHGRVTALLWIVNLGWLLPMAWLCRQRPHQALWVVTGAFAPLVLLAIIAGAGRAETTEAK